MTTFKTYLKNNAKFFSPTVGPQDDFSARSVRHISILDLDTLDDSWTSLAARYDPGMVDSMLTTLDEYLQDTPMESQDMYDRFFGLYADGDNSGTEIKNEIDAWIFMQNTTLITLSRVMRELGHPITRDWDATPPGHRFVFPVHYACYGTDGEGRRVLIQAESPATMNTLRDLVVAGERDAPTLSLTAEHDALRKMCLCMAAHKARWGALTSHEKWLFLRLHPGDQPFISFSNTEKQADNTRPFRALLAMILAADLNLEVESHPDLRLSLTISDENQNTGDSVQVAPPDDQTSGVVDLLLGWSNQVVAKSRFYPFNRVDHTEPNVSLGAGTVTLSLHRLLESGSTGVVYLATLGDTELSDGLEGSYAVKIVQKSAWEEQSGQIARLRNEFEIYRGISRAKQDGSRFAPRCYGLYESSQMLALVLDYEGVALEYDIWTAYSLDEKRKMLEQFVALHKVGIRHNDFEPRNIIRRRDGSFAIVDFGHAEFHDCPGIKEVSWRKYGNEECGELRSISFDLA